jgi:glutamate formiminotransferase
MAATETDRLECVVNVSEGRDVALLQHLSAAAGASFLDVHTDADHHRSVFTVGGAGESVEAAVRSLARAVVDAGLDLQHHRGAHPRFGLLDVVPFVSLTGWPEVRDGALDASLAARDRFVAWAAAELGLPCFRYGPERTLPDVRRHAWRDLAPDAGPATPHPTAGAVAVGARPVLVAYNLWLAPPPDLTVDLAVDLPAALSLARSVAAAIRGPTVRALGLAVGDAVQVSCNLIDPWTVGPEAVFDAVASRAAVARAELVGLVPRAVLQRAPRHRWPELDLDPSATIEARLERAGLDGGSFAVHSG